MKQETVFTLTDIRYVRISCSFCKTRVVLDLKEKAVLTKATNRHLGDKCPCCQETYASSLHQALNVLQSAYDSISNDNNLKGNIVFIGESPQY